MSEKATTREEQLAQCAEQLLASFEDGRISGTLADYYKDIFTLALKGELFD